MNSTTSNVTGYDPVGPPFEQTYWVICESLLVILTLMCAYIFVCLMKHAVVKPRKRTTNDHNKVQKFWLKWLPVFISVMLFLRLCSDHAAAFYGWQNDDLCFITVTVSTVLFTIGLYAVYIFLWVRQSIFYADPIMKKILRPCVTFFSWFSLGFMLISGFTLGAVYNIPQATGWIYQANSDGCVEVSVDSPEIIPGMVAACTACFQFTLLALFIYPLLSRRTEEFRSHKKDTPIHSADRTYQTSTLSRSGEKDNHEDNDEVFEVPDQPSTSMHFVVNPNAQLPPSGLGGAGRGRRTFRSETDTDSAPEITRMDDGSWAKNPTIKRQNALAPVERKQKRKSILSRIRSLKSSSIFYRRTKTASVSSDIIGSPNTSDSEVRGNERRFGTLRRITKRLKSSKEQKKGQKLVAMMKKYTLLMLACVITDVGAAVVQIMAERLPELVYLVLFDVSLMVNLVCVILTFGEWEAILMPCAANSTPSRTMGPLKRRPTPRRKQKTRTPKDPIPVELPQSPRILELQRENMWGRRSSSRRSSASFSGYESAGSSHGHIYKRAEETKKLIA